MLYTRAGTAHNELGRAFMRAVCNCQCGRKHKHRYNGKRVEHDVPPITLVVTTTPRNDIAAWKMLKDKYVAVIHTFFFENIRSMQSRCRRAAELRQTPLPLLLLPFLPSTPPPATVRLHGNAVHGTAPTHLLAQFESWAT
jgi:hypothetical protein